MLTPTSTAFAVVKGLSIGMGASSPTCTGMESSTVDRADTPLEEEVEAKTVIEAFHKTAEEHAIRRGVVGMIFEAGALEPLRNHAVAGAIGLQLRRGQRQAKQRPAQPVEAKS